MATRYTRDELDRIGRKVYERVKSCIDGAEPWGALSSPRRLRYTQAGLAAIEEAEQINRERLDRRKASKRNTVRLRETG